MGFLFCPLRSGSSGNASYVAVDNTRLLVDAGLSAKAVGEALRALDVTPDMLDGILITHEHSDHIAGVRVLCRRFNIPVYANARTWSAMLCKLGEDAVPDALRRVFESEQDFYIRDVGVRAFAIPHDAAEPVGYALYAHGRKVAVATDIGHVQERWVRQVADADLVLLESNHDPNMLARSRYPLALQRRITGRYGHLSNSDSAAVLVELVRHGVRSVVLGHLSHETNTPELAFTTACTALEGAGMRAEADLVLGMAWRDKLGGRYLIEA